VTVEERGGRRVVRASVECDGALQLSAWFAPALLDQPNATRWGSFLLGNPGRDHADAPFEDPLGFPGLDLPVASGFRHQPGPSPMGVETALPAGFEPSGRMFAQVLVRFGLASENAWLSDAIEVTGAEETR
jgi:hypothetical protein